MDFYLPHDEWVHLAPEHKGRVRVNHNGFNCKGGRDSMTITRKEHALTAYCYRCGGRGFYRLDRHFKQHSIQAEPVHSGVSHSPKRPPATATSQWGSWPREVREWLLKGGITSVIATEQGFLWSDVSNNLWMPVRQYSLITCGWKEVGYVVRGFNPKSYLTKTEMHNDFFGFYCFRTPSAGSERLDVRGESITLCEDILSGIRVAASGFDAVAILGVHPKPSVLEFILKNGYKNVNIFLDGDNPTVRMKAREIVKRLPTVNCRIVETGHDPKSYTNEELKELLK